MQSQNFDKKAHELKLVGYPLLYIPLNIPLVSPRRECLKDSLPPARIDQKVAKKLPKTGQNWPKIGQKLAKTGQKHFQAHTILPKT